MSEIKLSNIPSMNIGKVVSQLTDAYTSVIKKSPGERPNSKVIMLSYK